MENFGVFILTALAAAILPGADFALVTKNTLAAGRSGGQLSACGVASGLLVHTMAAVLGLSAIIAQSVTLFEWIKYIGAAYLCYMGWMTFRHAGESAELTAADGGENAGAAVKLSSYFWQGALTNVLNPKASIFYLTLLPQFVTPGENAQFYLFVLGLTAVLIVLLWFLFVASAFGYIRAWFAKPLFRINFQRCVGFMLFSFGVKLALSKR
ncbi:LysE family translocator [Propionispora vibrioides]|uniref:Resistance to homoserine/threonine (RhtB) family protein n=1 Tax=Propionispora vibrioides TaxID=112903 RepID=A0A1H8TWR0_9FIRM|nr:LysE family translocator [Propionispora vibrioides]SEO95429.1 resistance to homoserine/threonine (RhtB) family protein [Propionispora vibrioides]